MRTMRTRKMKRMRTIKFTKISMSYSIKSKAIECNKARQQLL